MRIRTSRLLTLIRGNVYRSLERINADQQEQVRRICFRALRIVPTADKNCTTVPQNILKAVKTILYAQLHEREEECSTHFIRAVVLEQGVLAHMKYVIGYISQYEDKFRKVIGEIQKSEAKKELAAKRKIILKSEKRIKELDKLFKLIYEDKAKGNLSENRFKILADDYEQEQKELNERIISLTAEIEQQEEQADNLNRFIDKIHKYFDLQELTPAILNDMVKRVDVHAPQKINGKRTQEIDIYYDLVGYLPLALFENEKRNGIA